MLRTASFLPESFFWAQECLSQKVLGELDWPETLILTQL